MRTWYVPLVILDDNRVVAQHREIHTVIGSIMSPTKGYQNHPVTKQYNGPHLPCLIDYHLLTVQEMERRGWSGHGTAITEAVIAKSENLRSENTCSSWYNHVITQVANEGPYGYQTDLHDLITRWWRERKPLRNNLAFSHVKSHMSICDECELTGQGLVSEYTRRRDSEKNGQRFRVKGHASLRNKPEHLEAPYSF